MFLFCYIFRSRMFSVHNECIKLFNFNTPLHSYLQYYRGHYRQHEQESCDLRMQLLSMCIIFTDFLSNIFLYYDLFSTGVTYGIFNINI